MFIWKIFDYITNLENQYKMDPMLEHGELLREINETTSINTKRFKTTFPFSSRDLVLAVRKKFVSFDLVDLY